MPFKLLAALVAIGIIVCLAGCGSSYQDSTTSAVGGMRQVIETYNSAHPADLAGTAQICRTAYDDLGKKSSSLATASPPDKYKREAQRLRTAYASARSGFLECSRAASTNNFPEMVAAAAKIQAANAFIKAARLAEG